MLNIILDCLLKWFAPILSFTTEEIYKLISENNKSIHLKKFLKIPDNFQNHELNKKWIELLKIRNICNVSIEEKRATKEIGSSLEADLKINLNSKFREYTENIDLAEICITSKATITFGEQSDISVATTKALGEKCPVCWKISEKDCVRHS